MVHLVEHGLLQATTAGPPQSGPTPPSSDAASEYTAPGGRQPMGPLAAMAEHDAGACSSDDVDGPTRGDVAMSTSTKRSAAPEPAAPAPSPTHSTGAEGATGGQQLGKAVSPTASVSSAVSRGTGVARRTASTLRRGGSNRSVHSVGGDTTPQDGGGSSGGGRRSSSRTYGPGQWFGEGVLLHSVPHRATVVCVRGPAVLWTLKRTRFRRCIAAAARTRLEQVCVCVCV